MGIVARTEHHALCSCPENNYVTHQNVNIFQTVCADVIPETHKF